MNKLIISLFFLVSGSPLYSQSVFPYEEIKLEKPADYKGAEALALSASNYLLFNAYKKDDVSRDRAFQFLVKWTAGDKDFNFTLYGVILELVEEKELMTLFIPAMVKFCLENKVLATNGPVIETNAVKMVLDYCNNPANNFTLKKKHRKRMEGN